MNKKIFLIISFILLIVAGCSQQQNDEVENAVPVKVYVAKVEPISKYIRVTGSITADEDVIVYSKVSERIEKINVRPGQKVSKDEILAVQKHDILKQGMEMANSALKSAEAQARLTSQDFERMKSLFLEKAVSQQQFDQSKTANETAEHSLDQARSAYEQAKESYENSFVKAPFAGIVASIYAEENQMLNIGQPVVQVLAPSKMKSKLHLTGEDVHNVKVGQKVIVEFPSIHVKEFRGKVGKINSALDPLSKSLEVEIELNSSDNLLKSGMFGEFLIEIESKENSLVVPETSLIPQTEIKINKETGLQNSIKKYFVFVVENKLAKLKEVRTGILNDGQVEIIKGLHSGEPVVIVGQNIVREGQTVNIVD